MAQKADKTDARLFLLTLNDFTARNLVAVISLILRRAMRKTAGLLLFTLTVTLGWIGGSIEAFAQSSPYVVDGLPLGGRVRFESEAYKSYDCGPSEKFAGFTWCHREQTEKTNRGEVLVANSILHASDGTAVYANRYVEPAFLKKRDVRAEIDRTLHQVWPGRARDLVARTGWVTSCCHCRLGKDRFGAT